MTSLIDQATPLILSLILSAIGVVAVLVTEAASIANITDANKRKEIAQRLFLSSLPPNLCLGALSFDIWAITTLFTSDTKAIDAYNLSGKFNAAILALIIHFILYQSVLAWGGVVRGRAEDSSGGRFMLELVLSLAAVALCIAFQVY